MDSRNANPNNAYKGLKNSIESFIEVTLDCFTNKSKAYTALRKQKENRDETRELFYKVYNEVLAHNETIIYARLRPYYKNLHDSIYLKTLEEISRNKCTHFFTPAYSGEDIENFI